MRHWFWRKVNLVHSQNFLCDFASGAFFLGGFPVGFLRSYSLKTFLLMNFFPSFSLSYLAEVQFDFDHPLSDHFGWPSSEIHPNKHFWQITVTALRPFYTLNSFSKAMTLNCQTLLYILGQSK